MSFLAMLTPDDERYIQAACWENGRLNYKFRNTQRKIKEEWIKSKEIESKRALLTSSS